MQPRFSIAIPVHDMENKEFFLRRSLDALWNQSLQDFEIVITDNSEDGVIESICSYYGNIKYFRNPKKGMAPNTNAAISNSTGRLIKILYLDDYLAHNRALENIWASFKGAWLATGCIHSDGVREFKPHFPKYNMNILSGNNTIGSPSVVTIVNSHPMLFDEEMTWLLDCDYYKRMYKAYGAPTILNDIGVVIGVGPHQVTHKLDGNYKASEHRYLTQKYA